MDSVIVMNIFICVYVKEMCVFVYILLPHTTQCNRFVLCVSQLWVHVVANFHHLVVPVVTR